ncbi:hypothetical protein MTR67_030267 [Solanum verrucosum]|uniref:Gag-pol polyprotein n=1 Tax=Solanum verrucosum TaxID=315347 RepID=A0AAF0R5P8_SOLVR|nr:hypothetical protein MTR67_030267 [Solanum verrucosum]
MPPRRAFRGHPARHNVEKQGVPNAPEVQPQGEVTNDEFREAIMMLSQVVTNQVGQREARQEEADTSWIQMVADMSSKMSLFVVGLSSKEGKAAMLIGDMYISRLMVYVQQVEEEKLRDREVFGNKKAKTGNESGQQRGNVNRSSFQEKQKGPAPSSASALAPRNKSEYNS